MSSHYVEEDKDDDEVTLDRLNKGWLGKIVRQREAPPGYECNVGLTFIVGEVMLAGPTSRPMIRQLHGQWVPLDHCESIAIVTFKGDPSTGDTVLLSAGGRKCQRVHLCRENQTLAELLAQFEAAVVWLREAEDAKRNIDVEVVD